MRTVIVSRPEAGVGITRVRVQVALSSEDCYHRDPPAGAGSFIPRVLLFFWVFLSGEVITFIYLFIIYLLIYLNRGTGG